MSDLSQSRTAPFCLEPPTPGFWSAPARRRPIVAIKLGLFAAFLLAAVAFTGVGSKVPTQMFVIFAIATPFVDRTTKHSRSTARRRDLLLMEDPCDEDVCLVQVTIIVDGKSIGEDRGVAWFEDGLLLYAGHRTSFGIGGTEVRPRADWRAEDHGSNADGIALPLATQGSRATLVFLPLYRGSTDKAQSRFITSLYVFIRSLPVSVDAKRQWPPLE